MIRKTIYFKGSVICQIFVIVSALMLFVACGTSEVLVSEQNTNAATESQTEGVEPDDSQNIEDDYTNNTDGKDDTPVKGKEVIPPYPEPKEKEKIAIMEKYNLSEEMYDGYYNMHKDGWYNRGGYRAIGMSLDEYINMMEEQRISHESIM